MSSADTPQPTADASLAAGRAARTKAGAPGRGLSAPWRKVLADLWASKTRTILAALSIAIGVLSVGSVIGTFIFINRDLSRNYHAVNPSVATIYAWPNFDEDLITTVRHVPGVADVQGVSTFAIRARTGPNEWRTINLMAVDDLEQMRVNVVRPDSGDWPVGNREVLLERSGLSLFKVPTDQPLDVELANGTRRTLPVAGVVHDAMGAPAVFSGMPTGFVTFDTIEWLGGTRGYTRMYITLDQPGATEAQIKTITSKINNRVLSSGRNSYVYIPPVGEAPVQFGVDAMNMILNILAELLVFLSVFLIVNTVSALLLQQRRQIGVMKAIGAETHQIVGMYLAFVLGLGVLALIIAVPLAAIAAYSIAGNLASMLNFDLGGFEVLPQVVLLQALIAFSIPTLAALFPVLGGTQITIREAISNPGLGRGRFGTGWLDRVLDRVRFLSRPLLLALRNTFRRKGRLALTLVTLCLAGAMYIGVGSAQHSFTLQIDEFMNNFGEDVRISFNRGYRIDRINQLALATPGVARTELWFEDSFYRLRPDGSEGDSTLIRAPEWGSTLGKPKLLRGRWLLQDDQNALIVDTKFLSQESDLDVGSRVSMRMGDHDEEWVIVGVVPQEGNGSSIAYTNYAMIARLQQNVGWTSDLRVVGYLHDPEAQKALADTLSQRFKENGIDVSVTLTNAEFRQANEQIFNLITGFLTLMSFLIAVVGGIGLMGTMSMNVVERTREIGVLRAIGASDFDIQLLIVAEGLLIGLLSWAIATLAGLPISRVLTDGIGISFLKNPLPHAFALQSVGVWLGIVLALATFASILPAWNASRLTVREVLAYE